MNLNTLSNSLQEVGLSKIDAQVYLRLLKDSRPTITSLAKVLEVQRLTIYRALETLERVGLISKNGKNAKDIQPEPPAKVIALLKHKQMTAKRLADDLKELLPALQFEYQKNKRHPKVRYYETEEDFIALLDEIVEEAEDQKIYCIGSPDIIRMLPDNMQHYIDNRIRQGVVSKHFSFRERNFMLRNHAGELREVKWFPPGLNAEAAIIAYGNKVAIWNTAFPKIIVIEDKLIFNLFKIIFEQLWQ